MAEMRYLIVNADDFGMSPGVNRGIMESHARGILTSASLMVRWPAVEEAVAYSKAHPELSLGLHLDFGEWACRDGEWSKLYEVTPADDAQRVAEEVARQLARFIELVGKDPSHVDSHQHVHRNEPVRTIVTDVATTFGVPVRDFCSDVKYVGGFYGQETEGAPYPHGVSVEGLLELFDGLPAGVSEMGCHPGYDDGLKTMYRIERELEVKTLCDPRVRLAAARKGIELCSFWNYPR